MGDTPSSPLWLSLLGHLAATAAGGLIAVSTIFIGKRLERTAERKRELRRAYANWAGAMERCLSHHINAYRLRDQLAIADRFNHRMVKNERMRVSRLAGEAGRDTDAAHFELLMLERDNELREQVVKLTDDSKMSDLRGGAVRPVHIR